MITTFDNPYSPSEEFDEWYTYDEGHGYHTLSRLACMVVSSSEYTDDRALEDYRYAVLCLVELFPETYTLV